MRPPRGRAFKKAERAAVLATAIATIEADGTMRCVGPCGRDLPATADHFRPSNSYPEIGLRLQCRECERIADRDRKRAKVLAARF